jgi:biotin carboxyl carrier protein
MRYRHKKGARLALLSGHVAHVGTDWVELDDRFQQAAFAAGCEIEQNHIPAVSEQPPQASADAVVNTDSESVIRRALVKMIERSEDGDFTSTNLPNLKAVEKLTGTQVNKGDAYRIFRAMKAEASAPPVDDAAGKGD